MSDPTRFADDHPSELARSLLAAGLDDEPSPALLERTLAPLGLGVAVATLAETARAATTGAATLATSAAPPAATAVTTSLFVTTVKWVGIASIGGGLALGAANTLSPPEERSVTAATTAPRPRAVDVSAPVRAPVAPAAPAPEPAIERAVENEPTAPESPAASPGSTARTARSNADVEASKRSALLAEEAKVIDEAREAVATGDSARALRALRAHAATFEKPLLKPEALFLEMRALAAQGNTQAATRVAEELLRRYPKGPQAAAARAFVRPKGR